MSGDKGDNYLRRLGGNLSRKVQLRVGFPEGATYPDGTPVAAVAAIQNFGAPNKGIPPRPFFSSMIADKSPAWPGQLGARLAARDNDVEAALTDMGEVIAGQLREAIVATNAPALSPETARRKGSTKPLVDTGQMLASVAYEVVEDGG